MSTSSSLPDTPPGHRPTVATACGKVILLGEHSVVYGEPAIALPLTGYAQVYMDFGDFDSAGLAINSMHIVGLLMIALFVYLYVGPYQKFGAAVAASEWPVAAGHLNSIRQIVHANTMLGLITVVIGSSGRFWG